MVEVVKIEPYSGRKTWLVTFTEAVVFEENSGWDWVLPLTEYPDRMAAFVWAQKVIEEQEHGGDNNS